jgi:hypothetical protein
MNKNNNLGRFLLVVAIILWSLYEVYPPTARDLVQQFSSRAKKPDATFTNILKQAAALQKGGTNEFMALQLAAGTNDLKKYFPFIGAQNQVHPNLFILNRLQRDAAGKIKLGLDLQGGSSFLVEMDTNVLFTADATNNFRERSEVTSAALSQAVNVLRRRIDRFGVAEPIIQSAGGNRILIQLPGLSQADKDSAKEQISKKAYLEFRMVHDNSDEIISSGEPIPPGYELLKHVEQLPNNQSKLEQVIVKKKFENGLAGDIVKNAYVSRDNMGSPQRQYRPPHGHHFGRRTVFRPQHQKRDYRRQRRDLRHLHAGKRTGAGQRPPEPAEGAVNHHFHQGRGRHAWRRLHPQRHPGLDLRRDRRFRIHAGLLYVRRSRRQRRADHEHHHSAWRHVLDRHHVHAARHCGRRAHRRHGGGRERADLRAHPRGTRQGQVAARRD